MSDTIKFSSQDRRTFLLTLKKRWANDEVSTQMVDVDVRVGESDKDTIKCPAFYWEYAEYHFLLMKTGENKYRPQFFYQDNEEAGVDIVEFDDIGECSMALLKLQANHALSIKVENEENK